MDVLHRVADALALGPDRRGAAHRSVMSEEEELRLEVDDPLDRRDERGRAAHAVTAHRHEVREVAEQCREHVADEGDAIVVEPDDERVDGLAAGNGDQVQSTPAAGERVRVVERDVGDSRLGEWRDLRIVAACVARLAHDVGEEGERAADAVPVDPLVVGLAHGDVRLRDELGPRPAERVDAADVIGVALREDDEPRRRGRDRVVVALVRPGFEPHPGVDDDPSVVGGDEVGRRHPG